MTTVSASPAAITARPISYVEWGPIIAGAVATAAIAFVLLTFGSAIGLTAVSPWPNSGLPGWLIAVIAALWLLMVQAGSYALGGYIAGRLRAPFAEATLAERQFRDGTHGFLVWALGVVISAMVVSYAAGALTRTSVEATSNVVGGAAQGAAKGMSGALVNAADPTGYVVDRLFRPATTATAESAVPAESAAPATATPATPARADARTTADSGQEVSRIFAESLANDALAADDRAYLAAQVAARTGLPLPEAEKRVDDAFAAVQQAEAEAREAVDEARRAAAIGAFLTAAALLIAAAAAAAGAGFGGRHRDENGALRLLGRERFW